MPHRDVWKKVLKQISLVALIAWLVFSAAALSVAWPGYNASLHNEQAAVYGSYLYDVPLVAKPLSASCKDVGLHIGSSDIIHFPATELIPLLRRKGIWLRGSRSAVTSIFLFATLAIAQSVAGYRFFEVRILRPSLRLGHRSQARDGMFWRCSTRTLDSTLSSRKRWFTLR